MPHRARDTIYPSLPGLIRQAIRFERLLRNVMDSASSPRMTRNVAQRLAKISDSNFKQPSVRVLAPPRELGF
jgi:hypothetical protein